MNSVSDAVAEGRLGGRVWFYSNYHCNLVCTYCLTESSPQAARRVLPADQMLTLAEQARTLGFTDLGVTGGEPFLLPGMPTLVAALSDVLPTVVLSNATLFHGHRLDALAELAGRPVAVQVSLDAPDAGMNDDLRGPGNFASTVEAIRRLVARGIRVRIATTDPGGRLDDAGHARLCELHRQLGIPDSDHVVRPVVRRGRAATHDLGVAVGAPDLPAELCVTVDGAFWSPFAPTVRAGRPDTDLLITRTIDPLQRSRRGHGATRRWAATRPRRGARHSLSVTLRPGRAPPTCHRLAATLDRQSARWRPGSHWSPPRCARPTTFGTSSSSVAMVSFHRFRNPNVAITPTSSTISPSSK